MGYFFYLIKTLDAAYYLTALGLGVMSYLVLMHLKVDRKRRLVASLLIAYVFLVIAVAVLARGHLISYDVIIKPFRPYVSSIFGEGNKYSVRTEIVLNVLMLVPVGFLLPFLVKKHIKLYLYGFLCSLFIEVFQLVTRRGYFEINDLICNVIGVVFGYSLFSAISKVINKKMPEQEKIWVKISKKLDDSPGLAKIVIIGILVTAFIIIFLYHFCADIGWNGKGYRDKLSIIKDVVAVLAFIISAVSLFLYTQREKRSYLRLMANSYKYDFRIDLENVGPGLAEIIDIEVLDNEIEHKSAPPDLAAYIDGEKEEGQFDLSEEITNNNSIKYKKKLYSNLEGDVIVGGGIKHHLFRCTVEDYESLNNLWKKIEKCKIIIRYRNVFGIRYERICSSHFERDYQTFKAAIGDRNGFEEENKADEEDDIVFKKILAYICKQFRQEGSQAVSGAGSEPVCVQGSCHDDEQYCPDHPTHHDQGADAGEAQEAAELSDFIRNHEQEI